MLNYYDQFFTNQQVDEMLHVGEAIEGTNGGLLLGSSHDEGGIYFLQNVGYGYKLKGEVEGYEYMFNPGAKIFFQDNNDKYNNYERDSTTTFAEYTPASHISIIDARKSGIGKEHSKFVIMNDRCGFSIFNKYSTKIHLEYLNQVNNEISFRFGSKSLCVNTYIEIISKRTDQIIGRYDVIVKADF